MGKMKKYTIKLQTNFYFEYLFISENFHYIRILSITPNVKKDFIFSIFSRTMEESDSNSSTLLSELLQIAFVMNKKHSRTTYLPVVIKDGGADFPDQSMSPFEIAIYMGEFKLAEQLYQTAVDLVSGCFLLNDPRGVKLLFDFMFESLDFRSDFQIRRSIITRLTKCKYCHEVSFEIAKRLIKQRCHGWMVRSFIAKAVVNEVVCSKTGTTVAQLAVRSKDSNFTDYLDFEGAIKELKYDVDGKGNTLLHHACMCGNRDNVKTLISNGFKCTKFNDEGDLPIHLYGKYLIKNNPCDYHEDNVSTNEYYVEMTNIMTKEINED